MCECSLKLNFFNSLRVDFVGIIKWWYWSNNIMKEVNMYCKVLIVNWIMIDKIGFFCLF